MKFGSYTNVYMEEEKGGSQSGGGLSDKEYKDEVVDLQNDIYMKNGEFEGVECAEEALSIGKRILRALFSRKKNQDFGNDYAVRGVPNGPIKDADWIRVEEK